MSQAVVARQQGDNFQARVFWLNAALLLDPSSGIVRVAYETGPKAFDDVLVEYDPANAPQDHTGRPVLRDHLQCKWHVRPGDFGHADLIDPAFSNAQTQSFLQRARGAQVQYAPNGEGARFKLMTNWSLRRDDPLARVIQTQWQALDLKRLFDGTTDASAMGKMRRAWCDHLQIDEDSLRLVARTVGVTQRLESGQDLRDWLNDRFRRMGLVCVPSSQAGFFYDDLITKLHAQGRSDFNGASFKDMCNQEKLFDPHEERKSISIGVRSFMHPIDNIESRAQRTVNLVPHFNGRFIRDEEAWSAKVFPQLRDFALEVAQKHYHLRLILDVHVSLAFGIGTILNVKSGKFIEIEQRTGGRNFWSSTDVAPDAAWPTFVFETETVSEGPDVAVAVSVTHDVGKDVRTYVKSVQTIGRILHARLTVDASRQSIQCGRHAQQLADSLLAALRANVSSKADRQRTHFFIAGPNAFAFLLGQNQSAIGATTVYEWDFEGNRDGSYRPGLSFD